MSPIVQFVYIGLTLYLFLIALRLLLEPFVFRPRSFLYSFRRLARILTEPYLKPFRRIVPKLERGSVDWSALVALIVLLVIIQVVRRLG